MEILKPKEVSKHNKWVSDGLEDEIPKWHHQNPVFISAQTGSGKNHFIVEKLLPYAVEHRQRVFIFSNRIALSTQQKRIILRKLSIADIYSDDELKDIQDFGYVTIATYQSALNILGNYDSNRPIGSRIDDPFPRSGYVIFDEAHFFLSDSLFNAQTDAILRQLIFSFSSFVRIYLSATPERVIPIINTYELSNESKDKVTYSDMRYSNYARNNDRAMIVYNFPRNYSDYRVQFFTDFEHLYEKIAKATSNNKWLCFINNRNRQRSIKAALEARNSKLKIDCFDSSKKDNNTLWNALIQGKIPNQILLTTIALDNGINLTDSAIHNIVVESLDKISLLQMIGRKRRSEGETINLFIHVPSEAEVRKQLYNVMDLMKFLGNFQQNGFGFLRQKWPVFHEKYRNLFYVYYNKDYGDLLAYNHLASHELSYLCEFFNNLLLQIQNAKAPVETRNVYPKMVLEWLSLMQDIEWVESDKSKVAIESLISLLEAYRCDGIPKNEHDEFFQEFKKYADIIGGSPIKADARSGPKITSTFLKEHERELHAKYRIEGKGTWKITKEDL